MATPPTSIGSSKRLRRVLTLWDLILYGVICINPVAPLPLLGVLVHRGNGHAATAVLVAMFAMLLTAVSYGRMANAYPSAGSAFTYVGQEISPALGYVTGWGMVMDYVLNPLICIIWCSQQAHVFFPRVAYWQWATAFAIASTGLNVQGVKTSARVASGLAAGLGLVVAVFVVAATFYVLRHPHADAGFFTRPFYDPQTWSLRGILGGTSIAVATYIGFDAISTLSEEANNPRRHILPATVLTCVTIGILSVLEVYTAQLVWPTTQPYPDLDTAFTFVAQRVWAPLFGLVGVALVVATFGAGMGAQLGAARLLYGMGRSGALPQPFFGELDRKRHIPRNNVLLVGALALGGAFLLPAVAGEDTGFELGANLLNFGALVAFMGVNAAALVHYYLRADQKKLVNLLAPMLGFLVCLLLWWNLSARARIFGAGWMVIGIAFGAWKTRGFQASLINFALPAELSGAHPGPETQTNYKNAN